MTEPEPNLLGAFLRARRGALDPQAIGLAPAGSTRRVAGLRREEVAALAGMSTEYYARIEQGRHSVSARLLPTLADVLRLDPAERAYLAVLVRGGDDPRPAAHTVRPQVRQVLERLTEAPAVVLGRGLDVLAWNRIAMVLIADLSPAFVAEHNAAQLLFSAPRLRAALPEWQRIARAAVGVLRMEVARHPDDERLAALIARLSERAEFRAWWQQQTVALVTGGRTTIEHPLVGPVTVNWEPFPLPDDPGQRLVVFDTEPGSASERALRFLAARLTDGGKNASPWRMEHPLLPGAHGS